MATRQYNWILEKQFIFVDIILILTTFIKRKLITFNYLRIVIVGAYTMKGFVRQVNICTKMCNSLISFEVVSLKFYINILTELFD